MSKKAVLGRGLGALIDSNDVVNHHQHGPSSVSNEIEISHIEVNPWQPRSHFDEEALNELSISIKQLGVIQPITLRKLADNRYQIISGERRFRASKIAGLVKIPAYIREADDDTMLELALVENIQREDLDDIEVAISYQRLIDECQLTQEAMSERIGKKRSTIANHLRLLKLPAEIQLAIREKHITMGHAKAIISIESKELQMMIFEQILRNDFNVRKTEEVVRNLSESKDSNTKPKAQTSLSEEYEFLKLRLSEHFKTNIQFARTSNGAGKITIPFRTDEELEKIMAILDKGNE